MPDNVKLKDLKKCKAHIGDIAERFETLSNLIQTAEEVAVEIKDRDKCIAAANRIIVDLNEIREMLEQNIMIVELTT